MEAMTDTNEGTTATIEEAPAEIEAATTASTPGTPQTGDEVTTLRSRNAGLDAKVTELQKAISAAEARAEEAQRKLNEYVEGKANSDEDTRALLQRLTSELDAERQRAKTASIAAKYPETFSVLGDAVANMTEDALAAAEARFLGVPAESHRPPTPVGNGAPRPEAGTTKSVEDMSLQELKAYAAKQFGNLKWGDIVQSD